MQRSRRGVGARRGHLGNVARDGGGLALRSNSSRAYSGTLHSSLLLTVLISFRNCPKLREAPVGKPYFPV
jgi:hypothetical protein